MVGARCNKHIRYSRCRLVTKNGNLQRPSHQQGQWKGATVQAYRRTATCFQYLHSVLVSLRWSVVIFLITLAHLSSWTVFAILWYIVSMYHGDLIAFTASANSSAIVNQREPCVLNVDGNFMAFFLFSIETQATIGYGHYQPTSECLIAVPLLALQATIGVIISMFSAGIVLNKLTQPKTYDGIITFSYNAVVSNRDGKPTLMICVCNPQKILVIDTHVSLLFVQMDYNIVDHPGKECLLSNRMLPRIINSVDLTLTNEAYKSGALFFCPTIIEHTINETSPLYDSYTSWRNKVSHSERYEIIVTIEGVIDSTGSPCHFRTSYIPEEILWGFRFMHMYMKISDENQIIFNVPEIGIAEKVSRRRSYHRLFSETDD